MNYSLGTYDAPFSVAGNGQRAVVAKACDTLIMHGPSVKPYCPCTR